MSRSSFLYFYPFTFLLFTFTLRADALDHEIHGTLFEAFGQCHLRNRDIFQTVGSSTAFTEEMHMQVFVCLAVVAVTQLVAHTVATILDNMHQTVLFEQ